MRPPRQPKAHTLDPESVAWLACVSSLCAAWWRRRLQRCGRRGRCLSARKDRSPRHTGPRHGRLRHSTPAPEALPPWHPCRLLLHVRSSGSDRSPVSGPAGGQYAGDKAVPQPGTWGSLGGCRVADSKLIVHMDPGRLARLLVLCPSTAHVYGPDSAPSQRAMPFQPRGPAISITRQTQSRTHVPDLDPARSLPLSAIHTRQHTNFSLTLHPAFRSCTYCTVANSRPGACTRMRRCWQLVYLPTR